MNAKNKLLTSQCKQPRTNNIKKRKRRWSGGKENFLTSFTSTTSQPQNWSLNRWMNEWNFHSILLSNTSIHPIPFVYKVVSIAKHIMVRRCPNAILQFTLSSQFEWTCRTIKYHHHLLNVINRNLHMMMPQTWLTWKICWWLVMCNVCGWGAALVKWSSISVFLVMKGDYNRYWMVFFFGHE